MENIRAIFNSLGEMEAAAAMLREQGVIDIKLQNQAANGGYTLESMQSSLISGIGDDEGASGSECIMEVVVESSRFRQVEDTIARYGGAI
ncbi:hypothetical protein [Paenibacillus agricola]|uniref:Uncharacterized protein n=1 Tax=Paenibacillus agricola TaxID=2716264 RepID=A0ABX0JEX3_9BACL|nr:hypothetical protein [Paenibacillus agricola]NHN32250.1 hypothetical protein [Paenibacillus agricola]